MDLKTGYALTLRLEIDLMKHPLKHCASAGHAFSAKTRRGNIKPVAKGAGKSRGI